MGLVASMAMLQLLALNSSRVALLAAGTQLQGQLSHCCIVIVVKNCVVVGARRTSPSVYMSAGKEHKLANGELCDRLASKLVRLSRLWPVHVAPK